MNLRFLMKHGATPRHMPLATPSGETDAYTSGGIAGLSAVSLTACCMRAIARSACSGLFRCNVASASPCFTKSPMRTFITKPTAGSMTSVFCLRPAPRSCAQ